MGNCLRHQSSTTLFSDDEWDEEASDSCSFETSSTNNNNNGKTTSKTATNEVKIKITKKQLAELLGKVDVKELRVEQILAHLMAHHHHSHAHATPWRPALQSIPE